MKSGKRANAILPALLLMTLSGAAPVMAQAATVQPGSTDVSGAAYDARIGAYLQTDGARIFYQVVGQGQHTRKYCAA